MTFRGRGCLEIKPSENPFFQPVSADIGKSSVDYPNEWKIHGSPPKFSSTKHNVDGNFSFLYTRESDRIGDKVNKPQTINELKMLSRTEFLKQRRERALASGNTELIEYQPTEKVILPKVTPEEYLQMYKHEPKQEDPRYLTSAVSTLTQYTVQ
jgi:hypothetical protein